MASSAITDASNLSTPFSHNLSHASQQANFKAINSVIDKFVDSDLEGAEYRGFDDFVLGLHVDENVLPGSERLDEAAYSVAMSARVQELIEDYCKPVNNEKERYGPFCELVNHISCELGEQNIVFCRNDPNMIAGSHSNNRCPDVIGVENDDDRVSNGKWQNYHSGSNIPRFTWNDTLHAVELKLKLHAIDLEKHPISMVPKSTARSDPTASARQPDSAAKQTSEGVPDRKATDSAGSAATTRTMRSLKQWLRYQENSSTVALKRKMQEEASQTPSEKRAKREEDIVRAYQQQIARYGMDQMSRVYNRQFCFGLLVVDEELSLAYYDRIGVVYSSKLDFVAERYRFVLLIKALCGMSRAEAGFLDRLETVKQLPKEDPQISQKPAAPAADVESNKSKETESAGELPSHRTASGQISDDGESSGESGTQFPSYSLDRDGVPLHGEKRPKYKIKIGDHTLYLYWTLARRPIYGLITRATLVFNALCLTLDPNESYAVKLSWPHARRPPESTILEHARKALEAIDMTRDAEFDKLYGNRPLADCLPELYEHDTLADLLDVKAFRRKVFRGKSWEEFLPVNRNWRAFVYEFLVPIYMLPTLDLFKLVIRDVVLGHHFLSVKGILHRDISTDNIMARVIGENSACGVLNDWDLATVGELTSDGHAGTRTGTRPFMAIELLLSSGPPIHLERFDWESFFYVICRVACRYLSPGVLFDPTALAEWDEPSNSMLVSTKTTFMHDSVFPLEFTEFYKPLVETWAEPLRQMFSAGIRARSLNRMAQSPSFDNSTLNGTVTWDKVWDILRK